MTKSNPRMTIGYHEFSDRDIDKELSKTILVIPSINGGHLLERMIPTLNIPTNIIYVLDQDSTDNTHAVCNHFGVNLVQLGERRTYTQCCNIGLQLAKDHGADYFYISNNDITFTTDVCRELLQEIVLDQGLGILSCSQLIVDESSNKTVISNYVYWNLSEGFFEHHTDLLSNEQRRIEVDFCELTFAIIRTSAAVEIGGFDDGFGFYHEDADFGFRLREIGYAAAYLPQSQIQHFAGATFRSGLSELRRSYITNSKTRFMTKHLGHGVNYSYNYSQTPSSWTIVNRNLYSSLYRIGLIDQNRPSLVFSHPGERPFDYLYSVWETSRLPKEWLRHRNDYKSVFLPCKWNLEAFDNDGFLRTHYVPLGVDTDIFHENVPPEWAFDGPTFLWFSRTQYRKGFDVLIRAWHIFKSRHSKAKLIVMGHGVLSEAGISQSKIRRWREYSIFEDHENDISYREVVVPLSERQVAAVYRSVDCVIVTSRSEGFGFNVVEAMSCGTMVIFPEFGSTADMIFPGALTFGGEKVKADYSDKGFIDVGTWWEPFLPGILDQMERVIALSTSEKKVIARNGKSKITSGFTWRNTAFAMRAALKASQIKTSSSGVRLKRKERTDIASWIVNEMFQNVAEISTLEITLVGSIDDIFSSFDCQSYIEVNPDILQDSIDPLWHFIIFGWVEDRPVSAEMDVKAFLSSSKSALSFLIYFHGIGLSESNKDARRLFAEWENHRVVSLGESTTVKDLAFIRLAYRMILRRLPDASGLGRFMTFIGSEGRSRKEMVDVLSASPEAEEIRHIQ